ncbi:MAG TPA: flagellar hook protein FlgE [Gemmatimonadaceae bacterium]|nr:flagellar hook protein FlgE [Gemmatimonadaceae bacterium]
MMRSLFSAVSGLQDNQTRMDVIGNNIANVNTVAFKAGRVTFKEAFAQLLQDASRPPGETGGTDPIQLGLGSAIGSIDTLFAQGNIETTGINTDLAIQGNAFFVVAKGNQQYYTRAGNFQVDADGRLVSPTNGFVVQGQLAVNGQLTDTIQDIKLPFGQKTAASATTSVSLSGNLDAGAPIFSGNINTPSDVSNPANQGSFVDTTITTYDSLGNQHDLKVTAWKTAPDEWDWQVDPTNLNYDTTQPSSFGGGKFIFNSDGTLDTTASTIPDITFTPPGADAMDIKLDAGSGTVNGLSDFSGSTTAVLSNQDGFTAGTLENFSIDRTGLITGAFTNGVMQPLGQIVLADFNNPGGLLRSGDNMYTATGNSGTAVLGLPLQGSQSMLTSGALEDSNVDLATEFTNMIVAERGFQANSRVITTSDQMLQEVVNLKQ